MFPLVYDLAADGIAVTATCPVVGFSPQGFYRWRASPTSARDGDVTHLTNATIDIHADNPEFGDRGGAPRRWEAVLLIQRRTRSQTKAAGYQRPGSLGRAPIRALRLKAPLLFVAPTLRSE